MTTDVPIVYVVRVWHNVDGGWSGIYGTYSSEEAAHRHLRQDCWTKTPEDECDADFFRGVYDEAPRDPNDYNDYDFEYAVVVRQEVKS